MEIKRFLGRIKLYLDRGKAYFGTLQIPLTILTFLGVYKDTSIGIFIFQYSWVAIPLIVFGFFFALIIAGRFDYSVGLVKAESVVSSENNPIIMEIRSDVKKILGAK